MDVGISGLHSSVLDFIDKFDDAEIDEDNKKKESELQDLLTDCFNEFLDENLSSSDDSTDRSSFNHSKHSFGEVRSEHGTHMFCSNDNRLQAPSISETINRPSESNVVNSSDTGTDLYPTKLMSNKANRKQKIFIDEMNSDTVKDQSNELIDSKMKPMGTEDGENQTASLLFDVRGREINRLIDELNYLKEDFGKQIRLQKHQISLLTCEKEGLTASLNNAQELLGEKHKENTELQGKIMALEIERKSLKECKEDINHKLESTKHALHTLESQLEELQKNETSSKTKQQYLRSIEDLREHHSKELQMLNSEIDVLRHSIEEKTKECFMIQQKLTESQLEHDRIIVEKSHTINRLTYNLESTQKQCEELLNMNRGQEISKLKYQYDALKAEKDSFEESYKSLLRDVCKLTREIENKGYEDGYNHIISLESYHPEVLVLCKVIHNVLSTTVSKEHDSNDLKKLKTLMKLNEHEKSKLEKEILLLKEQQLDNSKKFTMDQFKPTAGVLAKENMDLETQVTILSKKCFDLTQEVEKEKNTIVLLKQNIDDLTKHKLQDKCQIESIEKDCKKKLDKLYSDKIQGYETEIKILRDKVQQTLLDMTEIKELYANNKNLSGIDRARNSVLDANTQTVDVYELTSQNKPASDYESPQWKNLRKRSGSNDSHKNGQLAVEYILLKAKEQWEKEIENEYAVRLAKVRNSWILDKDKEIKEAVAKAQLQWQISNSDHYCPDKDILIREVNELRKENESMKAVICDKKTLNCAITDEDAVNTRSIKQDYWDELHKVQDNHKLSLKQMRLEFEEDRKALMNQHKNEIDCLQDRIKDCNKKLSYQKSEVTRLENEVVDAKEQLRQEKECCKISNDEWQKELTKLHEVQQKEIGISHKKIAELLSKQSDLRKECQQLTEQYKDLNQQHQLELYNLECSYKRAFEKFQSKLKGYKKCGLGLDAACQTNIFGDISSLNSGNKIIKNFMRQLVRLRQLRDEVQTVCQESLSTEDHMYMPNNFS